MPFRFHVPLPGPVVWVPGRRQRRRGPQGKPWTPEQWAAVERRVDDAMGRVEAAGRRLDARAAGWQRRTDERVAELQAMRELPVWPRFLAAMGLRRK